MRDNFLEITSEVHVKNCSLQKCAVVGGSICEINVAAVSNDS